ncbi:MAG: diguanylate cyclase [Pseudomonadota bacterium]
MSNEHPPLSSSHDFRARATLGVAVVGMVLVTPFGVNNLIQGRLGLGAAVLLVVALLAFNAWLIHRGRFYPQINLFGLVPILVLVLMYVLREQGIVGVLWTYPVILAFYFMLPERSAWFANLFLLAAVLPLAFVMLEVELAARAAATLLSVSTFTAVFVRVIGQQQERLQAQLVIDPLTGAHNRLTLQATLTQAIAQARRGQQPMSLIVLDLDHFKAINDSLGHDAGDAVLRGVGMLLAERMRAVDRVFRMGGEEFLVFLYGTDLTGARQVAEALRQAIGTRVFLPDRPVTASLGVATLAQGEDWLAWIKRGDENLYRAKAEGRDRVVV